MSESKEKGLASASDLLALSGGTKEVTLKTCGWKIKIKKATCGEIADIYKATGDNVIDQFIWLAFKCMVHPKMKISEIKSLRHDIIAEIGAHIAKFSGLDKASVERMRNLLETEPAGPSS